MSRRAGTNPVGRVVGNLAGAGGIQLPQDLRRQQFGRGGAAGKPHRVEHLPGELPQVPIRTVQRGQMPVIPRQRGRLEGHP
jgi:hypothetical protein